ncbi:ATP phosphoribosyltransferase [Pelosinus fermentans]|uniref:ATP phosphoribosyltransferase n=1 Tax=Pelosinus fermentans TaxID=365349 RepID=UPI0002684F88|nr:ATP phosphoribosyltransferase [Pelosinus fermentans]OAM96291.1 ATP phosphoribosyltransferase [Pelosinus fermentans DSM 17108]SDR38493.1 ATP phosphoribosyltransferase [Pelosinus fermentans]
MKIALPKGRLMRESVEYLAQRGLCGKEIFSQGRSMIWHNQQKNLTFVQVKPKDIMTYISRKYVDAGILGKDLICDSWDSPPLMHNLGFGNCSMVLGGKIGGKSSHSKESFVVATEHPIVAKKYFDSMDIKKYQILELHGSVEAAVVLGVADCFIDIVETGTTLKANGLCAYRTLFESTAHLILSEAAIKNSKIQEEINQFFFGGLLNVI